ncbi:helix-turn-helix domain-containing protein [Pedobacter sp. PACM 27299]
MPYYWNISEIAYRVGYQHSNHFSAAFKKKFGVSPGTLLKKQK